MVSLQSEAQHHCCYLGFRYIEFGRWFFQACHVFQVWKHSFPLLFSWSVCCCHILLPAHSPGLYLTAYLWWTTEAVSESNICQGHGVIFCVVLFASPDYVWESWTRILGTDVLTVSGFSGWGMFAIVSYGFVGKKFPNCWKTWRQT